MTPLEIAAKARWESRAEGNFPHRWEDFTDEGRKAHMEDMRAALLALAEEELPKEVLTITGPAGWHVDMDHRRCIFRIIVRAIAEDRP